MVFVRKIHTDFNRGNSHHHHPHLHRKEHRDSKDKDPQSAHPNLQSHEGGTKSEGITPEESTAGSRRTSHDLHGWDRLGWERFGEKRVVKDGEVKEERERSVLRAAYVMHFSFPVDDKGLYG